MVDTLDDQQRFKSIIRIGYLKLGKLTNGGPIHSKYITFYENMGGYYWVFQEISRMTK